nr:MAG TPA: Interferon-induced protein [Caudoviricetes sp.]
MHLKHVIVCQYFLCYNSIIGNIQRPAPKGYGSFFMHA